MKGTPFAYKKILPWYLKALLQNFSKSLSATSKFWATESDTNFHTAKPQILGATLQKVDTTAI
jgi:hypothetical protein